LIHISVRDNGEGIDPAIIPNLFTKFTKSLFDIQTISKKSSTLSQHSAAIYEEIKDSMEKIIRQKISQYTSSGDSSLKMDFIIIFGNPSNEIIKISKNRKVDLIVIGSKGLSGVAKLKGLGSVSRNVSENTSCTITIIR
jgi:nucleotide-binding universal stress UspA family protein